MKERNSVLVIGGAGYIGSHVSLRLAEAGFNPIVYDNLVSGHNWAVQWGPFEQGDIRDAARLAEVVKKWKPIGTIHLAALIEVAGSQRDVARYYDVNVSGALNVMSVLSAAGVAPFVFSSTAATYGIPQLVPLTEAHPQYPINPYGRTKALAEQALGDFSRYGGLSPAILRYFNAAGADFAGRIGEAHDPETHAVALAIRAAQGQGREFVIFGTDYETRDGTAIRDYVHVLDLADAHVAALRRMIVSPEPLVVNLGSGTGTSVKELVCAVRRVSGRPFMAHTEDRRPGDPPVLVADNSLARKQLGWVPKFDLDAIVSSAWRWHQGRDRSSQSSLVQGSEES